MSNNTNITTEMIKIVKEKTGAGIVECRQTLIETQGNVDKAIEILKKKGLDKASKKEGRVAKEGLVNYKIENNKGLVIRVNCETEPVSKTDEFKKFVEDVTNLVFTKGYEYKSELPEDVEMLRKEIIAKLGENILIPDWKFINGKGSLYPYVHLNKIATIVDFTVNGDIQDNDTQMLLKHVAMQITAMNPVSVDRDSIPENIKKEITNTFTEEAKATGKPEKVIENIIKGKLEKYYSENVLLEQVYIMDEEKKVKDIIDEFSKNKQIQVKVNSFVRVSLQ